MYRAVAEQQAGFDADSRVMITAGMLLLAGLTAGLVNAWLVSEGNPLRILDAPNERSLHAHPTPRMGGLGILAGVALAWAVAGWLGSWPPVLGWIALAAGAVAAVSLLDDVMELPALPKFAVHAVAALLLMAGGLVLPWGVAGMLLSWLAIVWMLNLYNFMDGMDGFSGGMTLCGFTALGLAGWMSGAAHGYAMYACIVAASSVGFLLFNVPPARIFMGDVGSATLGLMAAAFSLWGVRDGLFPLWFPVLVFSPFVVDASITLMRRILRREKVWKAHRSHYYQRLVTAGWGHRKTVRAEWALMLLAGLSGLLLLRHSAWVNAGLLVWTGIYILLAIMTDTYCKRHTGRME